ncbi:MAG: protein kinase, partial [Planctomycetota bacterium]
MTANGDCPPRPTLDRLIAGGLDEATESRLIEHVDHCRRCQQRLDSPTESPALRGQLSTLGASCDSVLHEKVILDAKSILNHGETTESDAWSSGLVDHSERDGYEFVRPLGRGGMGVVFLAREVALDRLVAIKVLKPELARQSSAVERFLREARAAAAIKHPNVITIHSVSARPPFPYIVMEYVEGETLQQRLDRNGVFSPRETATIAIQIAKALNKAHTGNVVHRDIKPANILIESETELVKVTDFGLARFGDDSQLTRTGTVVGTPAFLAPEALDEDSTYDGRGDLFSLGSLMYAMCCGASPFQSDSLLKTLRKIEAKPHVPIRDRRSEVPVWLAQIIEKLLQKEPGKRFRSAAGLQQSLQAGLAAKPKIAPLIQAKKTRSPSATRRRNQAMPLVWSLVCALLVLVCILLLVSWPTRPSNDRAASEPKATGEPNAMRPDPMRGGGFGGGTPALDADFLFIVRGGFQTERFETLEEAIEAAESGDTVEIRTNNVVEVEPALLEHVSLTIAAGEGFEPTIQFIGHPEDEEDEDALLIVEGDLTLRGLTLVGETGFLRDDHGSLLRVDNGEFTASSCRFRAHDLHCLQFIDSSDVSIRDCSFHAREGTGIDLIANQDIRLELENCVFSAGIGIAAEIESTSELKLDHCTFIATEALSLEINDEFLASDEAVRLDVANCLFVVQDGVYDFESMDDEDEDRSRRRLSWQGRGNVYSGPILAHGESIFRRPRVSDWTRLSGESPIVIFEPFQISRDELWRRR